MKLRSLTAVAVCSMLLTGCSQLIDRYVGDYNKLYDADPVATSFKVDGANGRPPRIWVDNLMDTLPSNEQIAYLGAVINDSAVKCDHLLRVIGTVSRGIDTDLNIITTIATALATAFTPIGTIHALAAVGSVSSGIRGTLFSGLYGERTSAIIAAQIRTSYIQEMRRYTDDLDRRIDGNRRFRVAVEVNHIMAIHQQCRVDTALDSLQTKAGSSGGSASGGQVTADQLVSGKELPGLLVGGPYTVVSVAAPLIYLQRGKTGPVLPGLRIDDVLAQINAAHH